jgi:hypothetical protein
MFVSAVVALCKLIAGIKFKKLRSKTIRLHSQTKIQNNNID